MASRRPRLRVPVSVSGYGISDDLIDEGRYASASAPGGISGRGQETSLVVNVESLDALRSRMYLSTLALRAAQETRQIFYFAWLVSADEETHPTPGLFGRGFFGGCCNLDDLQKDKRPLPKGMIAVFLNLPGQGPQPKQPAWVMPPGGVLRTGQRLRIDVMERAKSESGLSGSECARLLTFISLPLTKHTGTIQVSGALTSLSAQVPDLLSAGAGAGAGFQFAYVFVGEESRKADVAKLFEELSAEAVKTNTVRRKYKDQPDWSRAERRMLYPEVSPPAWVGVGIHPTAAFANPAKQAALSFSAASWNFFAEEACDFLGSYLGKEAIDAVWEELEKVSRGEKQPCARTVCAAVFIAVFPVHLLVRYKSDDAGGQTVDDYSNSAILYGDGDCEDGANAVLRCIADLRSHPGLGPAAQGARLCLQQCEAYFAFCSAHAPAASAPTQKLVVTKEDMAKEPTQVEATGESFHYTVLVRWGKRFFIAEPTAPSFPAQGAAQEIVGEAGLPNLGGYLRAIGSAPDNVSLLICNQFVTRGHTSTHVDRILLICKGDNTFTVREAGEAAGESAAGAGEGVSFATYLCNGGAISMDLLEHGTDEVGSVLDPRWEAPPLFMHLPQNFRGTVAQGAREAGGFCGLKAEGEIVRLKKI